jgi:hypothetical protein
MPAGIMAYIQDLDAIAMPVRKVVGRRCTYETAMENGLTSLIEVMVYLSQRIFMAHKSVHWLHTRRTALGGLYGHIV